jgi:phage terminase large subunit-like protein
MEPKLLRKLRMTIHSTTTKPKAKKKSPKKTKKKSVGNAPAKKHVHNKFLKWRKDYYFDWRDARNKIKFFERECVHIKGECAGKQFKMERWQHRLVKRVFGWKRRSDGTRKYRVVYVEVPRKNGKSFLASGFGLCLTFADGEPGAEIVSAAADREQARAVFDTARQMVSVNPRLLAYGSVYQKVISVPSTASTYKVISAEAYSKHGLNLHGIILDELHVQKDRELLDVLKTSTSSRRQPLEVYCTTAGHDKNSICYEYHEYAEAIIEGEIEDEAFYPCIFSAKEPKGNKDPLWWTNEKVWYEANPNLGISKKLSYMRDESVKAQKLPSYENTFKRLELNIWTEQESRWIPIHEWDKCKTKYTLDDFVGVPCWAGLDLSSTSDITAFAMLFRKDGIYYPWVEMWTPKESMQNRTAKERALLQKFIKEGVLTEVSGSTMDYDVIRETVKLRAQKFKIHEIAIDRWNAQQLATQLENDGLTVAFFGQGYGSMSAPCKLFETLVLSKKIKHNGNGLLRQMLKNTSTLQDPAGNLKPDKSKSGMRIDGIVATIMALGRASLHKEKTNIYNKRGLRVV